MLYPSNSLKTKKAFKGSSLVSILVGLALGLVAILSVMTVYKTLVFRSTDMKISSKLNSQVGMGLLGSHMDMQKAGYAVEANTNSCVGTTTPGPSGTANTDFVIVTNAALATPDTATSLLTGTAQTIGAIGAASVTGTAVIWRWIDDASVSKCSGLVSTLGGLVALSPLNCTDATSWSTQIWTLDRLIESNTLDSNKAVSFSASKVAACSSFGAGAPSPSVLLNIWAGNSTTGLSTTSASCLQNICQ